MIWPSENHSLEELQADVDSWLHTYNELRPHSGRFCYGKTPIQTFNDAAHIARSKTLEEHFENPGIRPREAEIPSLEGVSAERGIASWLGNNLELNFNKTRIKELELSLKVADNLLSDF